MLVLYQRMLGDDINVQGYYMSRLIVYHGYNYLFNNTNTFYIFLIKWKKAISSKHNRSKL